MCRSAPSAPVRSSASGSTGSPAAAAKAKAQVAVARSILVIISLADLLSDPETRFTDLGYGYYQARLDTGRKLKNHIRQIQALGFDVTITKAA